MEITYRKITKADYDGILALQKLWAEENITYGYKAETMDSLAGKINDFSYVAENNDEIIGFLTASIHEAKELAVMNDGERYIEIEDIYISDKYRDQGIGSKLMEIALDEASEQDIERALVYSASKDLESIMAFYRQHGFKPWYVQMFK